MFNFHIQILHFGQCDENAIQSERTSVPELLSLCEGGVSQARAHVVGSHTHSPRHLKVYFNIYIEIFP